MLLPLFSTLLVASFFASVADADDKKPLPTPSKIPPPPPKKCPGQYEYWQNCGPALACQPNCATPPKVCGVPFCEPGSSEGSCLCQDGYIRRTESGPCVPKSECQKPTPKEPSTLKPPPPPPKKCPGQYEYWQNCGPPLACQQNCAPMTKVCDVPFCEPDSGNGNCVCQNGYIRQSEFGPCVLKSECDKCPAEEPSTLKPPPPPPKKCPGQYEYRQTCGPPLPCQPTCSQPNKLCQLGQGWCKPSDGSCVCQKGYIRRTETGTCVRMSLCPKKCPAKEHWQICSLPECEPTCANPKPICPATLVCAAGFCDCNEGLIRSKKGGPCVPPKNCYIYVKPK